MSEYRRTHHQPCCECVEHLETQVEAQEEELTRRRRHFREIGKALDSVRTKRDTGEPAESDWKAVDRLVREVVGLRAKVEAQERENAALHAQVQSLAAERTQAQHRDARLREALEGLVRHDVASDERDGLDHCVELRIAREALETPLTRHTDHR